MTPPIFLRGERRDGASLPDLHELSSARLDLPADYQQLTLTSTILGRLSMASSLSELSRISGTEEPDPNLIPEIFQQELEDARGGNTASYITAMRLLAGMVPMVDEENQDQLRTQALGLAEEAAEAVADSSLGSREKVSRLYDITVALAGALARSTRDAVPEAETQTMLALFRLILAAIDANEAAAAVPGATVRPTPAYMRHYCEAQISLLSGNIDEAFGHLLETRRIIAELPPVAESARGGIRDQILMGVEHAIQVLPRDASGHIAEAFRGRMASEILGYFYQVDYLEEHGEDSVEEAVRTGAQFNFVAGLAEDAGITPNAETGEFGEEERAALIQLMETLYATNEDLRTVVGTWNLGDIETKEERQTAFTAVLEHAAAVFTHVNSHREDSPYREILEWQAAQRTAARAGAILEEHVELRLAMCEVLGLPPTAPGINEMIARSLMEYGTMLPALLNEVPLEIRGNDDYRTFFELVTNGAHGLSEDGISENLTTPTEELLGILDNLRQEHRNYEPAFGAFYHSLAETEEIRPDTPIPEALRTRARAEAAEIESFSWRRVADNVIFNPESIAMILGGSLFAELGSVLMLGRAGAAGNLGRLVEGGRMTWRGEMVLGMGISLGMNAFSTATHLYRSERPVMEELERIGPGLALGTLVSGLALGGTVLLNRRVGGALFGPGSRIANPWARGAGSFAFSTGVGGGLMLAGGVVTNRVMSGEWHAPTGEEYAEMFLTMALWDLSARGLRAVGSRFWWRRQIGPHLAREVDALTTSLHEATPVADRQPHDLAFLRNYLGMRVARGGSLAEISERLSGGERPVFEGNGATRTLRFRRPGTVAAADANPAALAEAVSSPEFQSMMDSIYNEVAARLRANPSLGRVRIRMTREGSGLRPRILSNGDTGNPADTFEMGPDGVPVGLDGLSDPVLQSLMRTYGDYLNNLGLPATRLQTFETAAAGSAPRRRPSPALPGGGRRPPMTRLEAAQTVLGVTEAELATAREITGSSDYQASLRGAMRTVRRAGRASWVLATREGNEVDFHVSAEEPTVSDNQLAFRMDVEGRITNMGEGDAVLRAVIQATPQQRILAPSAGAGEGGRASETESTSAQRPAETGRMPEPRPRDPHREPTATFQTGDGSRAGARPMEETARRPGEEEILTVDDAEMVESESGDSPLPPSPRPEGAAGPTARPNPLTPPRVPAEAQALPPPLPPRGPAGPAAPLEEPAPRPSPRPRQASPTDSEDTQGLDLGSLMNPDSLALATDRLYMEAGMASGDYFIVEINPATPEIFRLVERSQVRRANPNRGYIFLNRVELPGENFSLVLHGEPMLPRTWRGTALEDFLRGTFSN